MKMPQPVQPVTPIDCLIHWMNFGDCKYCHREVRDELHLYNHFKKYHFKPQFFYWDKYHQEWRQTNETLYLTYKYYRIKPVARTK